MENEIMQFQLSSWDNSKMVESIDLDATADEIRAAFYLAANEYPGDCLTVPPDLFPWLEERFGINVNPELEHTIDIYAV